MTSKIQGLGQKEKMLENKDINTERKQECINI